MNSFKRLRRPPAESNPTTQATRPALLSSTRFSKGHAIIFAAAAIIIGTYLFFSLHAGANESQQLATAVQSEITKLYSTEPPNATIFTWPTPDGCSRCNAGIGVAEAMIARVTGNSQMATTSEQMLDSAINSEVQSGILGTSPTDNGYTDGESAEFFTSELAPAFTLLRPQLSQAEITKWTNNITDTAQWLEANGDTSWYANGNVVAGYLVVEAEAYQLTGNPVYKQYYDQVYNFLLNPDPTRWKGYGLITVKQPTKPDGSDGIGYLTEAGAGTNGFIPKGAGSPTPNSSQPLNGKASLQVTATPAANDGAYNLYALKPNTPYTLSFSAKVPSGSMSDMSVGYQQGGVDTDCLKNQTVSTSWTQYSCSFTTGSGTAATDKFYLKKTGSTAETWYINGARIQAGQAAPTTFNPGDPGLDVDYVTLQLDQLTRVWLINHDPNILKLMNMEMNLLISHANVTGQTNAPECPKAGLLELETGGGSRHGAYPRCTILDSSAYAVLASHGRTDLQQDLPAQINLIAYEFGTNMALGDRNYYAIGMIPASVVINELGLYQPLPTQPQSTDISPPTTPQGVTSSLTAPHAITIKWSPSTDNVGTTKYYIRRNGQVWTVVSPISPTGTTYTDTSVASGTSYSYTVTAGDAAGNISGRSAGTTPLTPSPDNTSPTVSLIAPTASATVSNTIPVTAMASDAVGISSVQLELDGKPLGPVLSAIPYSYAWNTTTVSNSTHTLTALATDKNGNAATAPSVTITVHNADTTPPSTPQGLAATATTSAAVNLSWQASTDNIGVAGYRLYRTGGAGGPITVAVPPSTSASATYTDSSVSANTAYSYTVIALDAAGNPSAPSTAAAVTTPPNPDKIAPSVPKNLAGSAIGQSSISLTWSPAADTGGSGLAGYHVYRGTTLIASPAAPAYRDTGLTASTRYTYRVSAYDKAANGSTTSSSVNIQTGSTAADKTPPTDLANLRSVSSSRTTTTIGLTWNSSSDSGGSGLAGYHVYRGTTLIASTTTPSYEDTGLKAGTSYSYYVQAYDNAGNLSAYRHILTVRTRHPWWQLWHLGQ